MGLLGGRYTAASSLPADDIRGTMTSEGRSLAQGALGWIWAHDERTIPLPGFRNVDQVDDNAGALAHGPLPSRLYAAVQATLHPPAATSSAAD